MSGKGQKIQTFVILDLETIGNPRDNFEKTCIREISLYAIAVKYLIDKDDYSKVALNDVKSAGVPKLPEVLNKITLMVCPSDVTDDGIEQITGKKFRIRNYEMLKNESLFDEGTADCINNFLGRLKKPICLVAHYGWEHDFPTIQYIYEKINTAFPSGIFCVDSLNAFREIDENYSYLISEIKFREAFPEEFPEECGNFYKTCREIDEKYENITNEIEILMKTGEQTLNGKNMDFMRPIVDSSQINWQEINEASPSKIPKLCEINEASTSNKPKAIDKMRSLQKTYLSEKLRVKRKLFVKKLYLKKYPVKGTYGLTDIYERCFSVTKPPNLHHAEVDVDVLTRLVLHYGIDFVAYAEERKILFADVPKPKPTKTTSNN